MTVNRTEQVTKVYISPACDIVEINTEGVLCTSFEEAKEYDDPYGW